MKHLHLATATAQHAAQWHASAAEVHDIHTVALVALPFLVLGMIRTIVKGRSNERTQVATQVATRAARTEELRQEGQAWLAANNTYTYGDAE